VARARQMVFERQEVGEVLIFGEGGAGGGSASPEEEGGEEGDDGEGEGGEVATEEKKPPLSQGGGGVGEGGVEGASDEPSDAAYLKLYGSYFEKDLEVVQALGRTCYTQVPEVTPLQGFLAHKKHPPP